MFQNLKTSTQISLKFTLFSAGILTVIAVIMNLFFFSFWYFPLQKPKNLNPSAFPASRMAFSPEKNFQHRELRLDMASEEAMELLDEDQWFHIAEIEGYYLYVVQEGNELRVRNVSQQVELQILLLWISIAVIGGGTVLSYLISLFFVKTALKKLNYLNDALENLDIDHLDRQIAISGHPSDEINRVIAKFNQALEKINLQTRGLKDFVRNASHELKTPLMVISSLVSLARKSKEYETALENIKMEVKRLDNLLETLLLITQVEEQMQIPKEKLELTQQLRSLIDQLQLQYQEKNLTLDLVLPEQLTIAVNPQWRTSIMTNLLSNAFKFVGEGGKIQVLLDEKSFQVWNNGESIPAEQKAKIWERFWQADSSHTDRKSFGLGLYLSKLFAQKQWFDLRCESEQGKGVRFLLIFK